MQHTHHSTPFSEKKQPIVLICDGVSSPANIGGLFRLADAFGIQRLYFCNAEMDITSSRLKRSARNTQTHVAYAVHANLKDCLRELREQGYQMIGLEITDQSKPIQHIAIPPEANLALVIGGERHGISNEGLMLVDQVAHIEMFGINSSMNVTQAAAIALFELTKS